LEKLPDLYPPDDELLEEDFDEEPKLLDDELLDGLLKLEDLKLPDDDDLDFPPDLPAAYTTLWLFDTPKPLNKSLLITFANKNTKVSIKDNKKRFLFIFFTPHKIGVSVNNNLYD